MRVTGAKNSHQESRARVRRAQTAYRTRKQRYVSALEEKCLELEGIVEEMINTFVGLSDSLLQSGIDRPHITKELKVTLQRFLELSRRAAWELGDDSEVLPERLDLNDPPELLSSVTSTMSLYVVDEHSMELQPGSSDVKTYARRRRNSINFGNVDPYLNCGVWGLPPQSSSMDGTSAIPYILARRDSFASRLFFGTIALAVQVLHEDPDGDIANSIFRFKFRHATSSQIRRILDRVLNMMLHGTSQIKERVTLADEVNDKGIKAKVLRELERKGVVETDFLTTWDVDRYLRNKWKLAIDSNTIRIQTRGLMAAPHSDNSLGSNTASEEISTLMAPTMIPGFTHAAQAVWDAQALVVRLKLAATTIGEGPRWYHADIDAAVEDFLEERRAEGQRAWSTDS
jgi:hypothetical protein